MVVDWIQDELLWDNWVHGVRTSGSGSTTMFVGGADWQEYPGCGTGVVALSFSSTGEPQYPSQAQCLEVVGISQMFCSYGPWGVVAVDYGGLIPSIWVTGGIEPLGVPSVPGTFSTTSYLRHATMVINGNFFLGGQSSYLSNMDSTECADRIWKRPLAPGLGSTWTACMDHPFNTFEMWSDTLLAIGFPTVTKVDTSNGSQAGIFDLFDGDAVSYGHTAIAGDTLFWACRSANTQLHVGRYLIGSGPVWEVALPFTGDPVELHRDAYGRLWTALGNNIIWLYQIDGTYESYTIGATVKGIDLVGNTMAITGSMDGTTSYTLHGHVTP